MRILYAGLRNSARFRSRVQERQLRPRELPRVRHREEQRGEVHLRDPLAADRRLRDEAPERLPGTSARARRRAAGARGGCARARPWRAHPGCASSPPGRPARYRSSRGDDIPTLPPRPAAAIVAERGPGYPRRRPAQRRGRGRDGEGDRGSDGGARAPHGGPRRHPRGTGRLLEPEHDVVRVEPDRGRVAAEVPDDVGARRHPRLLARLERLDDAGRELRRARHLVPRRGRAARARARATGRRRRGARGCRGVELAHGLTRGATGCGGTPRRPTFPSPSSRQRSNDSRAPGDVAGLHAREAELPGARRAPSRRSARTRRARRAPRASASRRGAPGRGRDVLGSTRGRR